MQTSPISLEHSSNSQMSNTEGRTSFSQSKNTELCLRIADDEIYVLNPLYRLFNSKHYVLACGAQGLPEEKVHRAIGVILALCNRKRTVADIAKILRPLVKIADDVKAVQIAKQNVKSIIHSLSRTKEERLGQPQKPSEYPATTILISKADFDRKFGHTQIKTIEYCATSFLPKDSSEMTPAPSPNMHEAVPVALNWHFTSECSTNCKYCYLKRRNVNILPIERSLALIEEAAKIGVLSIHPNGGDILLYPHLNDILQELGKHNFIPVNLSTKTFLSKEKANVIGKASNIILGLQFSIDSTIPDVADYLVGTRHFCDRILSSIDNALEAGIRVDAKVVITPYNILTIPKLYRDLKRRGVSAIRLATYRRSGFNHSDDLFNDPASFQWLKEQLDQLKQEFPDGLMGIQNGSPTLVPVSLEAKQAAWPQKSMCTAGRTSFFICTDGKVLPCEQMPETSEYFCGDVSYQSIQEVWDSDRLRELTFDVPREKFKGQACYDCKERETCINQNGNCIRDIANYQGYMYQPPRECPQYNGHFTRVV